MSRKQPAGTKLNKSVDSTYARNLEVFDREFRTYLQAERRSIAVHMQLFIALHSTTSQGSGLTWRDVEAVVRRAMLDLRPGWIDPVLQPKKEL